MKAACYLLPFFVWILPLSGAPLLYAQASPFVEAVPQCGGTIYERGSLVVVNHCQIEVYVTWTSPGDVWGAAHLGPGRSQESGQSASAVSRSGGVDLFTCPGEATPEDTQGRPVGPHYRGQYRCRR